MRIAYITAGAGGMYCGSCLHDNTLAAALQRLGHEVALVPTYTPIKTDEPAVAIDRVFYGAINVYLKQRSGLFRHAPAFLRRWLDRPGLLDRAARLGGATDPSGLGDLTLSVLRGEEGHQAAELEQLAAWLRDDFRPDVVHLTNSMFLGFARRLKATLGVPVLCSVQGEELFLDALAEPARSEVLRVLRERARDADGFVAPSRWYAGFMAGYLGVPEASMHVVRLGIRLAGHGGLIPSGGPASEDPPAEWAGAPGRPLVLGYMARICPEKGFDRLVEAFRRLSRGEEPGTIVLRAAGWLGERDRPFFEDACARLSRWGLAGSFEYLGEVDREAKIAFLHSLDVLSVPAPYQEPKGLYVLEALANGVPVVEPAHGSFPEMIEATGGGVLVDPDSIDALAEGIGILLADGERRRALGRAGCLAVHERFHDGAMAEETLAVYRHALGRAA